MSSLIIGISLVGLTFSIFAIDDVIKDKYEEKS